MTSPVAKTWNIAGRIVDFPVPKVMGILNVTPDSFFDGKRYEHVADAIAQAKKMHQEGADFIDVGGYSSRPGAADITEDDELGRILPVIREIKKELPQCTISVDTFRSRVAEQAVDAGASIVNDISGGELDSKMFEVVVRMKIPYVLMHMRGTPQNMTQQTEYQNLTKDIIEALQVKLHRLTQKGAKDVAIDPGFGFSKTIDQNFELLHRLHDFHILGRPVLAGLSRKSMIWRTLNVTPNDALNGTTALNMIALRNGASILRVHDVAEAKQCIQLHQKLLSV